MILNEKENRILEYLLEPHTFDEIKKEFNVTYNFDLGSILMRLVHKGKLQTYDEVYAVVQVPFSQIVKKINPNFVEKKFSEEEKIERKRKQNEFVEEMSHRTDPIYLTKENLFKILPFFGPMHIDTIADELNLSVVEARMELIPFVKDKTLVCEGEYFHRPLKPPTLILEDLGEGDPEYA